MGEAGKFRARSENFGIVNYVAVGCRRFGTRQKRRKWLALKTEKFSLGSGWVIIAGRNRKFSFESKRLEGRYLESHFI